MKKCIFSQQNNKKYKVKRLGIPWKEDKDYMRHGIIGGILAHGPANWKNACYLVSSVSGRKIRVRYHEDLHWAISLHIGERVMIIGDRYYDLSGKLVSMDAVSIVRNEMVWGKENAKLKIQN